jgi:hypothetical protein
MSSDPLVQEPGQRIPGGGHPAARGALRHAAAQPVLHGDNAGQGDGGDSGPAQGHAHRRERGAAGEAVFGAAVEAGRACIKLVEGEIR